MEDCCRMLAYTDSKQVRFHNVQGKFYPNMFH